MAPSIWQLHAAIDVVLDHAAGDWLEAAGIIEEHCRALMDDAPVLLLVESEDDGPKTVTYGFDHNTVGRYAVSRCGNVITLSDRDDVLTPGQLMRHFLLLAEGAVHTVVTVRYRSSGDSVLLRSYLNWRARIQNLIAYCSYVAQFVATFGRAAELELHSYTSESFVPDVAIVRHSLRNVPIGIEIPASQLEAMGFR